jgi:uncharacterized surface protein with fasciclin (FAS1) repeats
VNATLNTHVVNSQDIVDKFQRNGSYTKLVAALTATGLMEALRVGGPLTVFAPSDTAFAKLPRGAFDGLLKPENRGELARILKYHAISGRVTLSELAGKKFRRRSVEGAELSLDGTVGVTVNRVKVTGSEIEASNGVIHSIDTVLVPPEA